VTNNKICTNKTIPKLSSAYFAMRTVTPLMTTDNLNYSIMSYRFFFLETSTDRKRVLNIKSKSITLVKKKIPPGGNY
jgi:hypothetical protein